MNKLLSISVQGNDGTNYSFNFFADPKYLKEWRDNGLEIDEIVNIIPVWVVDAGLVRVWCFFQDIFHFKNPFS